MSNPIDTNSFTHYLLFESLGHEDLYQITEPQGFDAENFVIKQREESFGRDIFYGCETENLVFKDVKGERTNNPQVVHPNGQISEYLDMGLAWILETRRLFGYEGVIKRIIEQDGIYFTVGILDMAAEPDTDGQTYFGCKIIQNTQISIYKREIDTSIDVLSTKNIRGKSITPAPTLKFLRKAVPIYQRSKIKSTGEFTLVQAFGVGTGGGSFPVYFNKIKNVTVQDLQDTLTIADDYSQWHASGSNYVPNRDTFCIFKAKKKTRNTKIKINLHLELSLYDAGDFSNARNVFRLHCFKGNTGTFDSNFGGIATDYVWQSLILGTDSGIYSQSVNEDIEVDLGDLDIDGKIWFTFSFNASSEYPIYKMDFLDSSLEISGGETSLDTVISGVRYIDMIKQCSKFINNLPVDASIFDVGGEHYDNVCFNRALLSIKANNSLELIDSTTPEGNEIGQVITNISDVNLPLGMYFWNGSEWILINESTIDNIFLTDSSTPPGATIGQLAFNTNEDIIPNELKGLVYWNDTNWVSLQFTKPFLTSIKDCFEAAMTVETCSDYEIKEDKIVFLKYDGFYTNNEKGVFLINPSKDYKEPYNDRFQNNNIKIGFDTFETNRLSKNTTNDIHTEAEWSNPNVYVQSKFERSIKYIRSGFSAQAMVDLETKTPQTADDNDDKVYIVKIVPLPEGSFGEISSTLNMVFVADKLQILNRPSTGSDSDVVINWRQQGFSIGDSLEITDGENVGTYTISDFTNSLLTLTPVGFTPSFVGDAFIKIKFYYIGIFWQTMTDEGYSIQNLENSDRYPNLDYSLRRIFSNWGQYIKSMGLYHLNGKIRNLRFKNNPPLISQKDGGEVLKEKGDILISDLPDPILGSFIYNVEIFTSYSKVLTLLQDLATDRGFIRGYSINGRIIKGYIKELDYTWKTGRLVLTLEEKYEADLILLNYTDGILTVNDTPYNLSGAVNWWKITGDYFQCFDSNQIAICNIRHFSNVSLNGVIYETVEDLHFALINL